MKTILSAMIVALFAITGSNAYAGSCESAASRLAASKGGSVLSVSSNGNKCTVRLLIKSRNGPPKRQTFVINK